MTGHTAKQHRFLMANLKPSQRIAYDVKARKKVHIENPKLVRLKNRSFALKGTSSATGNKVYRILGRNC